jgi:hypothetical protein
LSRRAAHAQRYKSKMKKIIAYQNNNSIKPIVKIIDNEKNSIVIALIPFKGAHITIHKKGDKILQNLWDPRYSSSLTKQYVEVAKNMNYREPLKHEHYLFQREYRGDGIPLWMHKIDYQSISDRIPQRYKKSMVVLDVPFESFWLTFHFSINDRQIKKACKIVTSLGNIFIECTEKLK